jgi:hypothetical protein
VNAKPQTLTQEEAYVARYLPGFSPREMWCSEFHEALDAVIRILESESPPVSGREAVEREMRRSHGR